RAADALIAALTAAGAGSTVVAVAHGLVVQAAINRLVELGIAVLRGEIPHISNGAWMAVPLTSAASGVLSDEGVAASQDWTSSGPVDLGWTRRHPDRRKWTLEENPGRESQVGPGKSR